LTVLWNGHMTQTWSFYPVDTLFFQSDRAGGQVADSPSSIQHGPGQWKGELEPLPSQAHLPLPTLSPKPNPKRPKNPTQTQSLNPLPGSFPHFPEEKTSTSKTLIQSVTNRADGCVAERSSVANGGPRVSGETRCIIALSTQAGLCVDGPFIP
jgi:hypothetical protein